MNEQRPPRRCARKNRQRLTKIAFRHRREFVDPRRRHEAFEAADTRVEERLDLLVMVWNDSAPKTDVDMALAACGLTLGRQRLDRRRRGDAVERHVDDR